MIRAEILRLRTLRSSWAFVAVLLGLVALVSGAAMSEAGQPGVTTPAELREPLLVAAGLFTAIMAAGFAAFHAAGEYRYETITQRLLAAPRRSRPLTVKLVVHGTLAALLGAIGFGLAVGIAQPFVSAEHLSLGLSGSALAELAGALVLAAVLFAMLGAAAGFILRSQATAVVAVVGAFAAEKILSLLIGGASAWLPYGTLFSLLGLGEGGPSRGAAAIVLTVTTAAVVGLAALLLARRDVS
jgi:ABC-2 type transport system permease protein